MIADFIGFCRVKGARQPLLAIENDMADVFEAQKRSEIMSRVTSSENRATELRLIRIFRTHRITGWRRKLSLFGRPDFVFPKSRLVVFVDGCFWHGCPRHGSIPATNSQFWQQKLERNKARDRLVNGRLRALGWRIVRIWQHDLTKPTKVVSRISRRLLRG